MPSTIVRIMPPGSRPGMTNFATTPTTSPKKDEATTLQRFHKVKAEVDRLIAEAEAAVKSPEVRACKLAQDVLETSRGPSKDSLRTPSRTTRRTLISSGASSRTSRPRPQGVDAQSERRPGRCCDLNPWLASQPQ
jgi:hypothetical protein